MTLLAAEKISKRFDERILFDSVSFTIKAGDRIGLVGSNGSGKTTLLEMLADRQAVDSGAITRNKKCVIEYVEQEKTDYLDLTLFDYVASARQHLLDMRLEMSHLQDKLAHHPHDQISLSRLGQLQNQYELENGFNFESEIKAVLTGVGFEKNRYDDLIRSFSGGERNRASLAKVLAGNGNLLLLDEPTNHLDIDSTCWLEDYLAKTDRAYVVVSHDRTFLENTIEQVWDICEATVASYPGSFENYLSQRAERQRLREHHYQHQQDEIRRIEEFIRRNMAGQKTKQAQSKLKYLQRIKRLPPPEANHQSPNIRVESSGRSYAHVLAVHDVSVGYGSTPIVEDIDFDVYRGDKIGMIGPNGGGKSTILKSLIGELSPMAGEIKLGDNVDVAYFDQELSELDPDRTVLENLWEVDPTVEVGPVRSFLGRFGFSGDDTLNPVSTLSGGEKTKLSLARLLYHPANFIILDEPTNHLDLTSRQALEEALMQYSGSLLIVSHDRYFLNRVVNRILHVHHQQLDSYEGDYSYFKEKTDQLPAVAPVRQPGSREAYLSFKEKSKRRSRHKKDLKKTRDGIAMIEKELEQVTETINSRIPKSDWEKLAQATALKNKLEDDILSLYQKLEQLEHAELD